MAINDGGPAFACAAENGHQPGMSLRDWFAGQALRGLLAGQYSDTGNHNLQFVPQESYRIADAMLKARASRGNE